MIGTYSSILSPFADSDCVTRGKRFSYVRGRWQYILWRLEREQAIWSRDHDIRKVGCPLSPFLTEVFLPTPSFQKQLSQRSGTVYEGDWEEDEKCGQGTVKYANGDKYVQTHAPRLLI